MNSCIQAQSETKQRTHMYTHTIWQCNKNRKNVYVFYIHLYCFMRYALFVSSFPFNCFFNSSVSLLLLLFHPFVSGFLCLSVYISISISQCIFHMCFFCVQVNVDTNHSFPYSMCNVYKHVFKQWI